MRWAARAISITGVSARPAITQPRNEPKIRAPGITARYTQVNWLRMRSLSARGVPMAT
jgi:hypothetical protein